MKSMTGVYKTFDINTKSLEEILPKPKSNPKNFNPTAQAEAASHVNSKSGDAGGKDVKAENAKIHVGMTPDNTPGAKASSPTPTTSPATQSATQPGSAMKVPSTSPTNAPKSGTPAIFKPIYNTPFTYQVQNDFFKSLSPAAKNLTKEYKLTRAEAAAIHAYTRNQYFDNMNGALRAVNQHGKVDIADPDALIAAGIKDIDLAVMVAAAVNGLKKLPPAQKSDVHFNSLGRNDSIPKELLQPFAEGASVTIPSFFSTTVSSKTVEEWWDSKDQTLCIFQRTNGNGRDVTAFSHYPKEKEILFIPGTQFMVIAKTEPTKTPSGIPNSNATKIKTLMQLQEVSADAPLPPIINPNAFQ